MKKNSWHYKLAKIGNDDNTIWSGDMSICQYIRKVAFGGVLASFILTVMGIALWWVLAGIYEIVGAVVGFTVLGPAAYVMIGAAVFIGLCIVSYYIKKAWEVKSEQLLKPKNKSFVASAYKSYKEKVCFAVKFDDE